MIKPVPGDFAALLLVLSSLPAVAQKERHFTFHYSFTVKNVTAGERLHVWIPIAHSDGSQDVKVVSQTGDLPLKEVQQPEYGNRVLYAEAAKASKGEYKFSGITTWFVASTLFWWMESQCPD